MDKPKSLWDNAAIERGMADSEAGLRNRLFDNVEKMLDVVSSIEEARVGLSLLRKGFAPPAEAKQAWSVKIAEPADNRGKVVVSKNGKGLPKTVPGGKSHRKYWTSEELVRLVIEVNKGHHPATLTAMFGDRTPEAVSHAASTMKDALENSSTALPKFQDAWAALHSLKVTAIRDWHTRKSPKRKPRAEAPAENPV
jgi:hypothetical protein